MYTCIYVSCSSKEQNLLYQNLESSFEEIKVGVSYSGSSNNSLWFDYNNDGFTDVYVGNSSSKNRLYKNNGDGSFTDVTEVAGVGSEKNPLSLMAGDLNNDGFLDIYNANINEQNDLYLNNGDGTFLDYTLQSRALDTQVAMGSVFFDYDNDGDLDIYLTHDNNQPNILYQNQGNARFIDVSVRSGTNYAGFGMGVDVSDFNRDGWLDIYITNLYENTLLINNGDGTFSDHSLSSGTDDFGMGWGTNILDYDNDGWPDIYVVNNSFFSDYPNILYKNNGDLTFSDVSTGTELESRFAGYGSATFDMENDGDLDIIVSNSGSKGGVELFVNEGNDNHWIGFSLKGMTSNKSAIGVRAEVYVNDITLIDEITAGTGYASQSSLKLHFGLGDISMVDSVIFRWPSGQIDKYYDLPADQYYKSTEAESLFRFDEITSTSDQITLEELQAFPNPTSNRLMIKLPTDYQKAVEYTMIDNLGQLVRQGTIIDDSDELDIEDLSPGLYLLKVNYEKAIHVKRIRKN